LRKLPVNVSLKKGDGGLPKASVVNVTEILTVNKAELSERLGRLPAATTDAIGDGWRFFCSGSGNLTSRGHLPPISPNWLLNARALQCDYQSGVKGP